MAQTVTQILLSQQAFTIIPPVTSVIGSISNGMLTVVSPGTLPIGVGIRGVDGSGRQIPAATVVSGHGPVIVGAQSYTVTPTNFELSQTTIYTVLGPVNSYSVTGEKRPAASYYLGNKCLQTVNIKTTNFTGTLLIEASLCTDPNDGVAEPSNWFVVHEVVANAQAETGTTQALASNTNVGINIHGNFVWMRARLVDFGAGIVNWVKVSY